MSNVDWLGEGLRHIWLPYTQMRTSPKPVAAVRTQGATIELADGRVLIDGIGSWWTSVHGYNHPKLKAALIKQLDAMPHVMLGGLAHESAYRLASRLADLTPGDLTRSFFCESGSVAVEVAMKVAVQYWRNTTGETRPRFVAFTGGYHGDTFATMSVCDPEEGMHALFGPALQDQYIMDLPEDDASTQALDKLLSTHTDIAAILVEPLIQGAGGMRMHDAATLKTLRSLCDQHGVLLIFDEIFTGFGRTGAMFAADKAGVVPDIMTLGKALTGGVTPLAAAIASARVYAAFDDEDAGKCLMHGPTFSGHALACAVAHASIDLLEENHALEKVTALETRLKTALAPLTAKPNVADVRILGAVAAVELNHTFDIEVVRARFIENGVFIRPIGKVIYLTPSYMISESELASLTSEIGAMVDWLRP